jgi:DNA-binding MarR family transcriptional regulator
MRIARKELELTKQPTSARICSLVKRCHVLMLATIEPGLAEEGLTFVQYSILASLHHGTARNPSDICNQFHHDSGALTRVIDQLAERGLLERFQATDRRKVDLRLTPQGHEIASITISMVESTLNNALGEFQSKELCTLNELLAKLNNVLQVKRRSSASRSVTRIPGARGRQNTRGASR